MSSTLMFRRVVPLLFSAIAMTACEELIAPQQEVPPPVAASPIGISWTCAMFPALGGGAGPQLSFSTPPLSGRQQQFTGWFNRAAISQNPQLANVFVPLYTLVGQNNALASRQGIFLNPTWFAMIGDIAATGIYAHELAHLAQFYGLVQAAAPGGTQFEGQADYIGGYMLRLSGVFSARDATEYAAFIRSAGGAGSNTHPPGIERESLFWLGWNAAGQGA